MCDFSGKLIAWIDAELSPEETAETARHLEACAECRSRADLYKRVSGEFAAFCDAQVSTVTPRGSNHWATAASAAGAIAALLACFLLWPRPSRKPDSFDFPAAGLATSAVVMETSKPTPGVPVGKIDRRAKAPRVPTVAQPEEARVTRLPGQDAYFARPDEPVVEIAIPAEEMFPPGAVPQGMNFVADVAIAADGSADRVQLRARLAAFERSSTQP